MFADGATWRACSTPPSAAEATPRRSSTTARTSRSSGSTATRRPSPWRPTASPASPAASPASTPASTTSTQVLHTLPTPVDRISGALFDLGVSSPQFDRGRRGFSYRLDGPLDMRMDPTQPFSADDVVNGYAVDDLTRVIRRYGDERFAVRIARAIVAARPIAGTGRARRDRADGDPGGHPPPRRPSGPAHVPGDPRRGQRRARAPAGRPRRRHRRHRAGWSDRRALVPLRRGPHRQGSLPPGHGRLRLPARSAVRVWRPPAHAPGAGNPAAAVGRRAGKPIPAPPRPGCASPNGSTTPDTEVR